MVRLSDIEAAIQKLPPNELAEFRQWFAEFDAARWDRQIESDVAAGKLDALADEAIEDLKNGRCRDL